MYITIYGEPEKADTVVFGFNFGGTMFFFRFYVWRPRSHQSWNQIISGQLVGARGRCRSQLAQRRFQGLEGRFAATYPTFFFVFGLGKWDEDFNTSFGSMHHFCWSSKSGQKLYVLSKLWIFFSHFLVGKKHEKLLLKIWKRPKYIGTSDRKYRPAWRKLDHEPYVLWAETFFPSP